MTDWLTKFGVGIGVIGAAFLLVNLILFLSQLFTMTPAASRRVTEQIIALNSSFVNLYLIKDGNNIGMIDAGADLNKVKKELAKYQIPPEAVQKVFLTHSDGDHTAALRLFPNAQVYLSRQEEAMINGKISRQFGIFKNKLNTSHYQLLADGEVVEMGGLRVRAIVTPGHTPGSMSYLVNNEILFTGDLLGLKQGKVTVFTPHFFNMNEAASKQSLAKLARLENIALLCTGHNGICQDFNRAMAEWR